MNGAANTCVKIISKGVESTYKSMIQAYHFAPEAQVPGTIRDTLRSYNAHLLIDMGKDPNFDNWIVFDDGSLK